MTAEEILSLVVAGLPLWQIRLYLDWWDNQ